jgi:hypothetical protein
MKWFRVLSLTLSMILLAAMLVGCFYYIVE